MKLTHIIAGQAGIHADNSEELARVIAQAQAAGFTVTDIEDDPEEPWHVATLHYPRNKPAMVTALRKTLSQTAE